MLSIHGLGLFHPPNVLDNAFFEALDIGTDEEWILSRVGIESRRTVLPLDYLRHTKNADPRAADEAAEVSNAEAGAQAARMALERAGIAASDVGMVIAGGCSPQHLIPAEASTVAAALDVDVPAFDMHAACSTFGTHLHVAAQMGEHLPDYVLCVQIENNTRVVDYRDRSTCVLWGDATTAAVISTRHPGRARVVASTFGGAPAGAMDVVIPRSGFFRQRGAKVQKFAIRRMGKLFEELRAHAPHPEEVVYVGHQANLTMLKSVARRAKLAPERHWFNIDRFGNQGSAGCPAVLAQRWDDIPAGTRVATVVVGSGLSWAGALLQFA